MRILGIIPSRYHSTRLPKKSLLEIHGKSIVQRVYEQAKKSKFLTDVIVATDNDLIYNHVVEFGGKVMMTSEDHQSGTDRCAEVADKYQEKIEYVINIQGDEPFIKPEMIDELASILDGNTQLGTLVKKIQVSDTEDLFDENTPKAIINEKNEAIYFSRNPIPYMRGVEKKKWTSKHEYFKHIGIYAYRKDVLQNVTKLNRGKLEIAESLEQLRWLENGYKIKTIATTHSSIGIDTQEDLDKARKQSM